MQKSETMVSFTLDDIKQRRAASGMNAALYHALTDAEAERNAANDAEDPTNHPGFWQHAEQVYPPLPRNRISIEIEEDILRLMQQRDWDMQSSINAALREYLHHHPQ